MSPAKHNTEQMNKAETEPRSPTLELELCEQQFDGKLQRKVSLQSIPLQKNTFFLHTSLNSSPKIIKPNKDVINIPLAPS